MKRRDYRADRRGRKAWIAAAAAAAAGTLAIMPPTSRAFVVSWNQPAGGNWSGLNWSSVNGSGPPSSTDFAAFNIANSYNVGLDVNPTVSGVSVGGSNVTFAGSLGHTLTNT